MGKRILVPVMPSEKFYDAVVAAGDLLAQEGGIVTFLFTTDRPPPLTEEKLESNTESELEIAPERADAADLDTWRDTMVAGMQDARDLLYERGITDEQVNYVWADLELPPAQSIADEASAGGYDVVVLARGYLISMPDLAGEGPSDVVNAVQELADDGVRLLVT